ncbi:chaperone protein HtpG [Granulicella sibirica]|uniref:Chaperone protein HtpG n=2 Tax=Granulicella sibirica TaxID=2479048 RepID=A0A4Q0SYY5_9BACT|nr:chaperone protein HtpG [Granulicella sibirica]
MFVILFGLSAGLRAQDGGASKPAAPAQPIAFNHKLHIQTAKLECNDCHESRGDGSTVSMPQPPKCMLCHASVATDKPDIQRLAAAAKNEDSIPWVRVYRVPSFVTFSHKTHTAAGNKCEECHGPVAERTAIALEHPTNMGSCIACHSAKQAPTGCDTCHGIMSKNGHSPFDADGVVLARLQVPSGKTSKSMVSGSSEERRLSAAEAFLHAPML